MLRRVEHGEGFEVRFSLTGGVLRAQGECLHDSVEISVAYWSKIAEERRRCDVRRVLVIENLIEDGRPDQLLALFERLTTMGFDGCKVAFVDNGNEQLSLHEHIAILAREHGILAAVFCEESAATFWLRHGEE